MPEVIESHNVTQHLARNGSDFLILAPGVAVRYQDFVHYNGRRYVVERVEEKRNTGYTVVRVAYRGKL